MSGFELTGKYNTAKVFTENVDNETVSQVISLLNTPAAGGSCIRIMPDCHAGAGCVIGTTMTLTDKVVPNLVGVDIGCGMRAVRLEEDEIDLAELDRAINERIPCGFEIRNEPIARSHVADIIAPVNVDIALKSLGTLGGGNHFIEVDRDSYGYLWLVIHTGSRHLGIEVCKHYQNLAVKAMRESRVDRTEVDKLVAEYKAQGRQAELSQALKEMYAAAPKVPDELAYITGQTFENYIHDMRLAQEHAYINRTTIETVITSNMGLHVSKMFDTVHNYIDCDNMILRKGSVSAEAGETLIIPMNMRDGSLICVGKGNPDWNRSAPHGAGRILSRSQAKEKVSMSEFAESMVGVYSTSVCESTIDESPMAYKPMGEIMENIEDTVEIVDVIKPIYNFKAH